MKQCPECNELFDDDKAFCDIDGSELANASVPSSANSSALVTGVIGGLVGVVICVLLYLLFLVPGRQNDLEQQRRAAETKETTAIKPSQVALVPATEMPSPTETDSPAEETPGPSPVAPAATPPPAALNHGPIATGKLSGSDRAIIKMKDGSTVEADAAWEDARGIWFRRSGLVSFVEKSRVEAITEPQQKEAELKTP
jgi:hypothetical protein